jgi:GTP-binding protein Era
MRTGTIAVVGRPNVGKSTLINALVGQKVSIVSDKAQTTRRQALGIVSTADHQIVFVDTPGIHMAHNRLGRALNEHARSAADESDALMVVVNVGRDPTEEDRRIASLVEARRGDKNVVLVMNKMDMLKAEDVEYRWQKFHELMKPTIGIMTSAKRKQNLETLEEILAQMLPEGEPLFDTELVTDQTVRTLAAEIVREKALHKLRQEVPHALATYVEEWTEETPVHVMIGVVLLCETEGQKAILIGKKGEMLKRIGTESRIEIEEMVDLKVFLRLFVRVRNDWRQSERILKELEYL